MLVDVGEVRLWRMLDCVEKICTMEGQMETGMIEESCGCCKGELVNAHCVVDEAGLDCGRLRADIER